LWPKSIAFITFEVLKSLYKIIASLAAKVTALADMSFPPVDAGYTSIAKFYKD